MTILIAIAVKSNSMSSSSRCIQLKFINNNVKLSDNCHKLICQRLLQCLQPADYDVNAKSFWLFRLPDEEQSCTHWLEFFQSFCFACGAAEAASAGWRAGDVGPATVAAALFQLRKCPAPPNKNKKNKQKIIHYTLY